jgi:RES domain-containing protein
MIRAWRLCRQRHASAPLAGEGARRVGGRWSPRGTPIAYCASSLSLAVLECLVHFDLSEAPTDYVAIPMDLPNALIERVDPKRLPSNWRQTPAPPGLARIGGDWARAGRTAVLEVPSAIIPDEPNFLVNPAHAAVARIRVGASRPFHFDPRLFVE